MHEIVWMHRVCLYLSLSLSLSLYIVRTLCIHVCALCTVHTKWKHICTLIKTFAFCVWVSFSFLRLDARRKKTNAFFCVQNQSLDRFHSNYVISEMFCSEIIMTTRYNQQPCYHCVTLNLECLSLNGLDNRIRKSSENFLCDPFCLTPTKLDNLKCAIATAIATVTITKSKHEFSYDVVDENIKKKQNKTK